MTLNELQNYYSNIEGCYGNCNCCRHYYLCDLIVELLENPEENKVIEEKERKYKLYTTNKGSYFNYKGVRMYLNDFIRV